ncbi:MAG: ATP-binding protein [Methylococcaceae bacterium]
MRHRFDSSKIITPLSEPGTVRLLFWIAIIITVGGVVMLSLNLINGMGVRPGAPILIVLGCIMLPMLRLGYLRSVAWTLCLGVLLNSVAAAYGTQGLLSIYWMGMPFVILIGGWLLGRRVVLVLGVLALAGVLGMYWLHLSGHQFPQTHALGTMVSSLVILISVSCLIAASMATVFQSQLTQLSESRTHLTTLFDSLDDLVWSVDTQNFRILSFNQAFAEYMLAAKDIVIATGMTPDELNPTETGRNHWKRLYRETLAQGYNQEEFVSILKNHTYRLSLSLMQQDGVAFAISVIAHNITEAKAVQQGLEDAVKERTRELSAAKEAAEVANQTKGYFLANMSHEIRTPLTALLGFAESLRDRDLSESERMESVHTIIRNSEHLQSLISDILDFSKIEAGQLDIETLPVPFPEFLADIHTLGNALATNHELHFSSHILPPIPALIHTDITRLRQILINLIGNAVKFTESPGRIRLLVSHDAQAGQLVFTVQDSGIGMSQDAQSRLFQPFVQADISTTRRFGGTGLGLSISRELALRLGGDIQVMSIERLGSIFTTTVATGNLEGVEWLENPEQWNRILHAPINSIDARPTGLSGQILLAEDTVDNQRLIQLMVRRTGAELTIAQHGLEAVEIAQEREFDLVLMDMQMPVMGGMEATRLLRLTGFDGPIVALTANATEHDKTQAREAGCDDFLIKPVNQQAFFQVLARYLVGKTGHSETQTASFPQSDLTESPEYQELKERFILELPERLEGIKTDLALADWPGLRFKIHQLKGVAGSFGFKETSRVAGHIENRLANGDYRPVDRLVEELVATLRTP